MIKNLLLATDSYKTSHYMQYPPKSEYMYSYVEARGGDKPVVVIGVEDFRQKYLLNPISRIDVAAAESFCKDHGVPFNSTMWYHILNKYDGYLPVILRSLPEGTVVPTGTVIASLSTDDPVCLPLISHLETSLLRSLWYPTTVASNSRQLKGLIKAAMEETCDNLDGLPFKLHDFGARGATCAEAAALGGMGHLVNFKGTDTMEAIELIDHLYSPLDIAGYSIPASEHSTMTSWGIEGEDDAYENMIKQYGGEGKLVSCVIDSWDDEEAIWKWANLNDLMESTGGTYIMRPDSGHPVENPVRILELLFERFGYTLNSKGCKVLPPHIRMIQGDGLDLETLDELLSVLVAKKYSIDNIAFGMGGGLLQKVDRDTLKFAMKCSSLCVNGEWRDVYKQPKNDPTKKSKKGIIYSEGGVNKVADNPWDAIDPLADLGDMKVYYSYNKRNIKCSSWDDIVERASI